MLDVFTKVVLAGAIVFTFSWVILAQRRTIRRLSDAYLQLTHFQRVLAALTVIVCTVYAQKPSTNDVNGTSGEAESFPLDENGSEGDIPDGGAGSGGFMLCASLTSGQESASPFAAPYRLESVTTNEGYSYVLPAGGTIRGTWHLTGAYEDVQKVALDPHPSFPIPHPFVFPLGSDLCTSLWAYTWGKIRPQIKNASNEIAAVGAPMSAIPGVSRFWTAATSNDTYLLTWENFALGRVSGEAESFPLQDGVAPPLTSGQESASPFLSTQIELFRNGDFITRSNDVECVYHRVNPDDIDDDGIPNEEDSEPVVPADEAQFGPHQTLPTGSDTNYYYWVDLVVGPANARVVFEGDGESNWPDPSFIAKAGETNRVYLLIGKTYGVHCPMPIQCVDKEDDEVEVYPDGDGLLICWDIRMEFVSERPFLMARPLLGSGSGSGGTGVRIIPGRAGGGSFSWPGGFCCYNFAADGSPVFNCQGNCGCGGSCNTGNIIYTYVGYSRDFGGWSCSCQSPGEDDDSPTVGYATAWFSKSAIIFEDEYEPSDGVTVPRRSTESTLTCFAYGGPSGGEATFEIEGDSRLVTVSGRTLPFTQRVGPNEDYEVEIVYQGKKGSGDQVQVTASFVSNDPDEHVDDSTANLEVVEIEIMCQIQAPENDSYYRHKFGVGETINCNHYPAVANLRWSSTTGNSVSNAGEYQCPLFIASNPLTAICGDATFTPNIQVVKPTGIEARNPRCLTYNIPAGRAGWVGLRQAFYVTPLDVSFIGIAMEEVPSTVGHRDGYFNVSAFSVIDCHSFALGAGRWLNIDEYNCMGIDRARLTLELQRVDDNGDFTENVAYQWRTGWITWEIPFGWASAEITKSGSAAQMIEQFDPHAGSRFDITVNGDVTVTKFGNAAKRDINANFTLNGASCTPEEE